MRAVARILLAMGHTVTGSDSARSRAPGGAGCAGRRGVRWSSTGHTQRPPTSSLGRPRCQTQTPTLLALSSEAPRSIREPRSSRRSWRLRPAILVAGTHGKTTTSSMLSVLLDHAGLQPSFIIGSDVVHFGTGARWETTEHFVVEADESDGTFLTLMGAHAIVTSLDPDHLEFYGSAERLSAAFSGFVEGIDGITAVCIDDSDTHVLLGCSGIVTYGTDDRSDLCISRIDVTEDDTEFDVRWQGQRPRPCLRRIARPSQRAKCSGCPDDRTWTWCALRPRCRRSRSFQRRRTSI